MSVVLKIESEIAKESFYVYTKDGTFSGGSLEKFLIALSAYYSSNRNFPEDPDELTYISSITNKIPDLELLANVWYEGDWDYQEDEYENFLANSPCMPLPKKEFEKCIRQIREKWTEGGKILDILIQLQEELLHNPIKDSWFFDQEFTMADLSALINTMKNLNLYRNERIRLKFC